MARTLPSIQAVLLYYNFMAMGETQAMKAVIKQLWRQYIKLNALPASAVPFDLDD